ncbi:MULTISPECIES: ATP-binding protein [Pseudomonas syringae group]|uniref:ATP-binding protein n=1 Tax=Pseudomonas syringae group TaxID=136849 RepID=UPI001303D687|nr:MULTISPECIES: ATP-binding protein [Pseudomonas syringae group]MCF5199898.1 ATP-binding protein [Pseudomonas syringae]MCF5209299.1 ATP-binding protein [Pseudomonas syringae]MCF5214956.1 ATP-binding protein [Pseudomonas syringae]MCF5220686.1 ATP-binding protein [Pseudomonas syringae]MCF5266660.1 ATP-binding protein [Pseudomonas syringae]
MQISRKLNIYEIEDLYQSHGTDPNLRLPNSMSHGGGLGVDAALAQFIVTWARTCEKSVLHLYASAGDDAIAQITQLAQSAAGFFALIMCNEVHAQDHQVIDRRAALIAIRPLVDAMFEGELRYTASTRGARPTVINLFSVNNAKREFIKPFYFDHALPKVQPKSWFSTLVETSSKLMNARGDQGALLKAGLPALGSVLWELISNADQHAVTDVDGVKYKKALRGTSIKFNRMNRQDALEYSANEPELARFILKHFLKAEMLDFLEISVIDSGPGLARRWLTAKEKRPVESLETLSLEAELEATLDCFKKHVTSKPQSPNSGMGLHNAVQALNKLEAFVRIRTGRLSLHQAFQGSNEIMEFAPSARYGGRVLAAVEGTVFTICIPVN